MQAHALLLLLLGSESSDDGDTHYLKLTVSIRRPPWQDFGSLSAYASWARRCARLALAAALPLLEISALDGGTSGDGAKAARARLLGHAVWVVEAAAIGGVGGAVEQAAAALADAVTAADGILAGKMPCRQLPAALARALHAASVRAALFDELLGDGAALAEGAGQMLGRAEAAARGALGVRRAEHLAGVARVCAEADERQDGAGNGALLVAAACALRMAAGEAATEGDSEPPAESVWDVRECAETLASAAMVQLSDYHEACAADPDRVGALAELLLSAQDVCGAEGADSAVELLRHAVHGAAEAAFARCVEAAPSGTPSEWLDPMLQVVRCDAQLHAGVLAEAARERCGGERGAAAAEELRCCFAQHLDALVGRALREYGTQLTPRGGLNKQSAGVLRDAGKLADALEAGGAGRGAVDAAAREACHMAAIGWAEDRAARLTQWATRALDIEEWPAPLRDGRAAPAPASQSAVDVANMWRDTFTTLADFSLPYADVAADAAEILTEGCARAATAYACSIEGALPDPHSLVPPPPPLSRFKTGLTAPATPAGAGGDARRGAHADENMHAVDDSPRVPRMEALCARVNSVVHMAAQLPTIAAAAITCAAGKSPQEVAKAAEAAEADPDASSSQDATLAAVPGAAALAAAFDALRAARARASNIAGYVIAFCELRDILGSPGGLLYAGGVHSRPAAPTRLRACLLTDPRLDEALGVLASHAATKVARDALAAALARAVFSALRRVLLDGGPARSFETLDARHISEDLEECKEFFRADGEGLRGELLESLASDLQSALSLMETHTQLLTQNYDWDEAIKKQPSSASDLSPVGPEVALRVLCHRADRAASKFLKKRFAVAKADGRTGLAFGRARARSAANLVEIELKY